MLDNSKLYLLAKVCTSIENLGTCIETLQSLANAIFETFPISSNYSNTLFKK